MDRWIISSLGAMPENVLQTANQDVLSKTLKRMYPR
jgi:hypothetical protein